MRVTARSDVRRAGAAYRPIGDWTGFDESRAALTPDELQAERLRAMSTPASNRIGNGCGRCAFAAVPATPYRARGMP